MTLNYMLVSGSKTPSFTCSIEVDISGVFWCWIIKNEIVTEVTQHYRLTH